MSAIRRPFGNGLPKIGPCGPCSYLRSRLEGPNCARRLHVAKTSTSAKTWTNPDGVILKQLKDNMWMAERPFVWNNIDVGGRMVVIKLKDGSLWVHSPVCLDGDLRSRLVALGEVKHIVSPNYEHVKYAKQWIEAYPEAHSYGCPGLRDRKADIPFSDTVGLNNNTPECWPDEIEVTHLSYDVNPFTGKPFFNEVLFMHTPSKALLVTDLFWNYPDDVPFGTKLWKAGMDKIYRPFYFRYMIADDDEFAGAMDRIFEQAWDMIVPCHGLIVDESAKQRLREFVGEW